MAAVRKLTKIDLERDEHMLYIKYPTVSGTDILTVCMPYNLEYYEQNYIQDSYN